MFLSVFEYGSDDGLIVATRYHRTVCQQRNPGLTQRVLGLAVAVTCSSLPRLKHPVRGIALAKALVPYAAEDGMVRDFVLDAGLAKPHVVSSSAAAGSLDPATRLVPGGDLVQCPKVGAQ